MIGEVSLTQKAGGISEIMHQWSSSLPRMLSLQICMAVSFSIVKILV